MALTIENGTVVSGANSYVTVAEYNTWADARFTTRSTPSEAVSESYILRATDYFERQVLRGDKANEAQPMQFPRVSLVIDGYAVDSDEIPAEVKTAIYELAYAEETSNGELNAVERKTSREAIAGAVDVTYADNSASRTMLPGTSSALRKLIASPTVVARV